MTLPSGSSNFLLFAIVCCILEFTNAVIPEGVYGDKEPQADPISGAYRVEVSAAEIQWSGECYQLISITGSKISDQISLPCATFPIVSADGQTLMVGEALYADRDVPGTLIRVTGRTCEKFTYEHLKDTLNIDVFSVTDKECRAIREKMKQSLTELAKKAVGNNAQLWAQANKKLEQIYADLKPSPQPAPITPSNNGSSSTPSSTPKKTPYDAFIAKPMTLNGKLVRNIAVSGPGIVAAVIQVPASEPVDVINSGDKLIVGSVLMSKEAGKIVVIIENKCSERTYAKDGTEQIKELSDRECQVVRKEIREARGEKDPNGTQTITQNFGQTANNTLGNVGQMAGQVRKPVESIRLIVSYLGQIVNMILSFITKNFEHIARNNSSLGVLENMAFGIMGLANKLVRRQTGNQIKPSNNIGVPTYENNARNPNSAVVNYGIPGFNSMNEPPYGINFAMTNSAGDNYGRSGVPGWSSQFTGGTTNSFNGVGQSPNIYVTRGTID